jgi:hypothetical protein
MGAAALSDPYGTPHACMPHAARAEKAKQVFPRPVAGSLKPVVRGQTVKYNMKSRLGRGFTLEELKVRILSYGRTGFKPIRAACHFSNTVGMGDMASCGMRMRLLTHRRPASPPSSLPPSALPWTTAARTARWRACRCEQGKAGQLGPTNGPASSLRARWVLSNRRDI